MKMVVICAHHISYNRGGLASITRLTARELCRQGYRVVILTNESDGRFSCDGCEIVLNPSRWICFKRILLADYVICEGAIFRLCWPLLLIPKKSIVVRHMPIMMTLSLVRRFFERWLSLNAVWSGVSRYVVDRERIASTVVPNACDGTIFFDDGRKREYDLVFLGGVNRIKGADLLFDAVKDLLSEGVSINRLTYIGEGDLAPVLMARSAEIESRGCRVVFTGNLDAGVVAEQLRCHRCLVVPSSKMGWLEAFGCVCIEGLACGCQVVASDSGGIPEAIGECGVLFNSDDIMSLKLALKKVLCRGWRVDDNARRNHLAQYTPNKLIRSYFKLMER